MQRILSSNFGFYQTHHVNPINLDKLLNLFLFQGIIQAPAIPNQNLLLASMQVKDSHHSPKLSTVFSNTKSLCILLLQTFF